MKKLEAIKTIQLIVFIVIAVACFSFIVVNSDVYHQITESRSLQLVCILLWVSLFASFFFVFVDFSMYARQRRDFKALDYAAHSDPLAKIANRSGADEIIEQYLDQPLPENMGCVMFLLTSLADINAHHTRKDGNTQIRNYSIILKLASIDKCFVGRNGGNVFLAIFEDGTQEELDQFLHRIEEKVLEYNAKPDNLPIAYQYGQAFHEGAGVKDISDLISLANRRAREGVRFPQGNP